MKNILVINEGYSSNLGDQAIKQSIGAILTDNNAKYNFLNYSNPKLNRLTDIAEVIPKNSSFTKNLRKLGILVIIKNYIVLIKKIYEIKSFANNHLRNNKYDFVLIGGGQLINSSYRVSPNPFCGILYSWITSIKSNHIPVYLYGIGIVNKFNSTEKYFYNKALQGADNIYVRDFNSQNILKSQFGLDSVKIHDVVFSTFKKNAPKDEIKHALVGVFSYHELLVKFNKTSIAKLEYYLSWYKVVRNYLDQDIPVSLFYTTQTDYGETKDFCTYLNEQHNIVLPILKFNGLSELLKSIGTYSHLSSGRMHALIFGLINGLELDSYLISNKVKAFDDEYVKTKVDLNQIRQETIKPLIDLLK